MRRGGCCIGGPGIRTCTCRARVNRSLLRWARRSSALRHVATGDEMEKDLPRAAPTTPTTEIETLALCAMAVREGGCREPEDCASARPRILAAEHRSGSASRAPDRLDELLAEYGARAWRDDHRGAEGRDGPTPPPPSPPGARSN